MDGTRFQDESLHSPHAQSSPRNVSDSQADLWVQFAKFDSFQSFTQLWLNLLCQMVEGASGALLLIGPPDQGPFTNSAVWPQPYQNMNRLRSTAERAVADRRGFVVPSQVNKNQHEVAFPLEVDKRLHGVLVLEGNSAIWGGAEKSETADLLGFSVVRSRRAASRAKRTIRGSRSSSIDIRVSGNGM